MKYCKRGIPFFFVSVVNAYFPQSGGWTVNIKGHGRKHNFSVNPIAARISLTLLLCFGLLYDRY